MSQTPEVPAGEEPQHQSWDDFWSEITPERRTETIRGVTIDVPANLPLKFTRQLEELKASDSEEDIRHLVGQLFGENTLDAWVDAGMTSMEFAVALAWGVAQGQGQDISFREAYEVVRTQGKSRTPESPSKPAAGGGRSKRISGGSTASRRRT